MRWFYIGVVVIFLAAAVILAVQNLQIVTFAFLGFTLRVPMVVLVVIVYVLGMLTGSSLWAAVKSSIERSKGRPAAA